MKPLGWWLVVVVGLLLLPGSVLVAQDHEFNMQRDAGIQQFSGTIQDAENEDILITLENLQAGDVVYAYAQGKQDVDPYLILTDEALSEAFAQDDNSGNERDAALSYTVDAPGTYVLGMFSNDGGGDYRVTVGINEPTALQGGEREATTVSDEGLRITAGSGVQEFSGAFATEDDEVLVRVTDVQSGDVLYVYAAGVGLVDTYVYVLDSRLETVYAEDDDGGGGYNSALSYTADNAGEYVIGLITINGTGNYTLWVGVNTPQVLDAADQVDESLLPDAPNGDFDCSSISAEDRPVLSGDVLTYATEAFVVHYTLSGSDATTEEYVQVLVEALERSLDVQINTLGWALPPADCGEGGDSRLDVYLVDLSDTTAIGYASPEYVVGDNPNTPEREYFAAYSYLVIENDMEYLPRSRGFDVLRATAAHELHHNIQFGYDVNDSFFGFYEAGASWLETLVYPTMAEVIDYVIDLYDTPDLCIGYMDDSTRIYGEWLMVDSFARDLGMESYQFIWEYLAANEGLRAFYRALEELDTTPQEVIERMAVRNLLNDYVLAKRFETTVDVEATLLELGTLSASRDGVQELGVDYVRIAEPGVYTLELVNSPQMALFVVGIDEGTETATLYDLGEAGTVDTRSYDYAYAFVLNTRQHISPEECRFYDWTIRASDGSTAALSLPDAEVWDASQFQEAR